MIGVALAPYVSANCAFIDVGPSCYWKILNLSKCRPKVVTIWKPSSHSNQWAEEDSGARKRHTNSDIFEQQFIHYSMSGKSLSLSEFTRTRHIREMTY